MISVGRGGRTLGQPTKHVRTHTHTLKPLNHFTVVPQPLSPLRFNSPGERREGVWAEWGYVPAVNWGQVTDTMLGLALLEYGRAARQVGGPLAGSPTWHAVRPIQAVRAQLRKGGFPLVDPAYVHS